MSNGPNTSRPCAGCGKPCTIGMIGDLDRWVCWDCKRR